jgi:hypothetical protein
MKRTSLAALLAAPLLLAFSSFSAAQPPRCPAYGFSPGGIPLTMFSCIHQHGPLFNYGPYYGYPPFEPYGPWNAYLQYNPWYYGDPYANAGGKNWHLCNGKLGSLLHRDRDGCSTCGWHKAWRQGGWFRGHECLSCGHKGVLAGHGSWLHGHTAGGCAGGACTASNDGAEPTLALNPETTDPLTRFAGAGNPVDFTGFYSGLPTLNP